jgi:hypothetical protein
MASYGFHSEAADEYLAATRYYLDHASPLIAAAFVAEVEAAIETLRLSHNMACDRRASHPAILAQAISIFTFLSLGARARSSFNLRCNAPKSPS